MKTRIGILLGATMFIAHPVQAQFYGQVPTVRYEGRPVESIVKDGIPVPNYDGDGRVEVDPNERRHRPQAPVPPVSPAIILLWKPWHYGLPYEGPRYVWGKVGKDAVLYDRANGQPIYVRYHWFR